MSIVVKDTFQNQTTSIEITPAIESIGRVVKSIL